MQPSEVFATRLRSSVYKMPDDAIPAGPVGRCGDLLSAELLAQLDLGLV